MNREEMFALALGQSCSPTEMKEKHWVDSWDLFAGGRKKKRTISECLRDWKPPTQIKVTSAFTVIAKYSTNATAIKQIASFLMLSDIKMNSGYLSGTGWRSSSGSRTCR